MELERLYELIERKRKELNRIAETYELTDFRVLEKSRELDRVLNCLHAEKQKDRSTRPFRWAAIC